MTLVPIGAGRSAWAPPSLRGGAALGALFGLRALARAAQPERRIARCGLDVILPRTEPVCAIEVREAPSGERAAWWRGVARCHRIACPVCAAQRGRRRAERVRSALATDGRESPAQHWQLITLTVPHRRDDALAATLGGLVQAWREVRRTRRVRAIFDRAVSATVRAIEVTWSVANGWHPHVHLLVRGALTDADVAVLREEWCPRTGASPERGVFASAPRLAREIDGAYLAKLGAEVGGEGKAGSSRSHWRVLERAAEAHGTRAGQRWRARWAEYVTATKGRRLFELDERAARLADASPPDPEPCAESWSISVWREELRQVAAVEVADREPATWRVLRAAAQPGHPGVAIQREIDATIGFEEPAPPVARAGPDVLRWPHGPPCSDARCVPRRPAVA